MTIGEISLIVSSSVVGISAFTVIFSFLWTRRKKRWERKIAFYNKEIDKSNKQIAEYKKEMVNAPAKDKIQKKIDRVKREHDSYVSKVKKLEPKIVK